LAALAGFENVRDQVASLLYENWPRWQNVTPDLPKVRQELAAIKAELSSANNAGGQ
jgi:hypothetical protein